MPTSTLKDSGPTTTITFAAFKETSRRIQAKNFTVFAFPDNEGVEIVFEGQWERIFKMKFQLKNDSTFPTSGDSAADKRIDLEDLIFSGGDSEGLFTLTFDSEDSTSGSPQTESYTGKIKNLVARSIAGQHTAVIDGEFEFWESNV